MTTNTAPSNGTQLKDPSQGPYISTDSLFSNSLSSTCNYHKSFDFSNINIGSSYYKQFHQTRIYVKDFQNMTTNGSEFGGKNSTYIISSNLPDTFNYAIGSEWGSPLSDIFKGVGNLVMQFASGGALNAGISAGRHFRSGINRAANFLIWNGAKPLEIQLKIPVLDDNSYQNGCGNVKTSLKEALEFLGCLCLPRLDGAFGFYTPAPSPLDLTIIAGHETDAEGNKGKAKTYSLTPNKARIMVQIGGMLFIDNCIIKNISVTYPNTRGLMLRDDGSLSPILAEVNITISTVETLTSTTYTKMLWRKEQGDQGSFKLDLNAAMETAKEIGEKGYNMIKQPIQEAIDTVNSTGANGQNGSAEAFKPGEQPK